MQTYSIIIRLQSLIGDTYTAMIVYIIAGGGYIQKIRICILHVLSARFQGSYDIIIIMSMNVKVLILSRCTLFIDKGDTIIE